MKLRDGGWKEFWLLAVMEKEEEDMARLWSVLRLGNGFEV